MVILDVSCLPYVCTATVGQHHIDCSVVVLQRSVVHWGDGGTRAGHVPLYTSRLMVLGSVVTCQRNDCYPQYTTPHASGTLRHTIAYDSFCGGSYNRSRGFLATLVVTRVGFVRC